METRKEIWAKINELRAKNKSLRLEEIEFNVKRRDIAKEIANLKAELDKLPMIRVRKKKKDVVEEVK